MKLQKIVLFFIFIGQCQFNSAMVEEMSCCSLVDGQCQNACSQISLVTIGADVAARENTSEILLQNCSTNLMEFWSCVNSTLLEIKKNEKWLGRGCCNLAHYPMCRSACALGGSESDLEGSCRSSDEPELFSCLEKREDGEKCCNNVSNSTCRSICRDIFIKPGKQSNLKLYSSKGCFHQIPKCLKIAADVSSAENPKQYLNCCKEAPNSGCLDACRKALHSTSLTVREMIEILEEKCPPPLPHSPLWSCLLQSTAKKTPRLPLDISKLTCCSRSVSIECQELCWKAFQSDWEVGWIKLESDCLYSPVEGELRRCLDDADEPCELGCSGLSYCNKFNNIININNINNNNYYLFRSCNKKSDDIARLEVENWSRGGEINNLGFPSIYTDPSCPHELLKTAACLLQLRPCENQIHETHICKNDCLELMSNCINWRNINRNITASLLCNRISPQHQDLPCISLKNFMHNNIQSIYPSSTSLLKLYNSYRYKENDNKNKNKIKNKNEDYDVDISTPCIENPCSQGEICIAKRNTLNNNYYTCLPGCKLGEMSKLIVPINTWIQIPRIDHKGCYKICQCTLQGIENCKQLNCLNLNSCWIQDRFISHRDSFNLDCNLCYCFEGEITCTRKSCNGLKIPSLPCDCPAHYVPVCGRSLGLTFASACLAKCFGLAANQVEYGTCLSKDPCQLNPCKKDDEVCVAQPKICLSQIYKPCKQYECVSLSNPNDESDKGNRDNHCTSNGKNINAQVVCDTNNVQYNSMCQLIKSVGSSMFGYKGRCLKGCSLRGPVCGINGIVYVNECAAWADKSAIDYPGPCIAVGLISEEAIPTCGDAVKCLPLNPSGCIGVIPPGACCPLCGGAARIFYSKKQLDRIYHSLDNESDKDVVTLEALLNALERQIQVVQCALRGFITPENDLFVMIQPTNKTPSAVQLNACIIEMEKLVTRISERSPKLVVEVPLNSLIRAEIVHTYVYPTSFVSSSFSSFSSTSTSQSITKNTSLASLFLITFIIRLIT